MVTTQLFEEEDPGITHINLNSYEVMLLKLIHALARVKYASLATPE